MGTRIIALASAVIALTLTGTAQAIDYPNAVRSPQLEAKLPTPVKVFCTQNTNESFAMIWDREIYLDLNACAALTGRNSAYSFGLAIHVLYHEWWHVAFRETDEQFTDCGSFTVTRYMLRTFWGYSPDRAQNLYLSSLGYATYAPLPCNTNAADPLLEGA